ncbi:MAG: glycoside hydrolase family 10 protein [Thermoguttaceae bacterium]|jgi:uncharacterized lipoprotein YddW (UPF0748 family)
MQRRAFLRLLAAISVLALAPIQLAAAQDASSPIPSAQDYQRQSRQFRGLWVSTVFNIDYPSKKGLTAEELAREADAILDRAVELKFNAIFLQVRPMGDAFYPSKLYPWSGYLSGEQGVAPDKNFDVLGYWVDAAHKRGLQLHAWINPYRVTVGKLELEDLAPDNPARQRPNWTFKHGDRYYLDPGIPAARKHVVNGIVEIVRNYDVDGVHIDDYFYPERKIEADVQTWKKYGRGIDDIEDWRRDNVNLFIADANRAIHRARQDVVWSVSPAGIWANKSSHPLGSDTRGNQCYFNLYADVRKWIKEETIDVVVPQIYWHIGFDIADFATLTQWWSDIVADTNVKLYVGVAAYRLDPNSKTAAWADLKELDRQLDYMATVPEVDGQVFFTEHNFRPGLPAYEAIRRYAQEHNWQGVDEPEE